MNILVTGSTGFLGKRLVETLTERGDNIRCIVRETSDIRYLTGKNVSIFKGDILNDTFLKNALKGIDIVYHLAALRGEKYLPYKEYETINVIATHKLLKAFSGERFIFCSTVGVMGYGSGLNEKSPLKPYGNYHISKSSAENLCKDFPNVIIIRPAIIYGRGDYDGFINKLAGLIYKKRFILVGRGCNKIHMVHIDNIVHGMIRLGEKGKLSDTYIVADRESLEIGEIVNIISQKLKREPLPFKIPAKILLPAAGLYERIYKFVFPGKEPFLSIPKVNIISLEQDFDISKALESGYNPEIKPHQGIEDQIEWMRTLI